jgi:hypothetical protein
MSRPPLPRCAVSALQKKPRYIRVTSAGPGHKSSLAPHPLRSENADETESKPLERTVWKTAPILELAEVEQQLRDLPDIRAHLFKLDDLISQIGQFHCAPLVEDSHIVSIGATLMKRFRQFYGEASNYFQSVKVLKESQGTTETTFSLSLSDLKAYAYDFVESWREAAVVLAVLKENGINSLAGYVAVKFKAVEHIIIDITTNNRRETVNAEFLLDCGGKLRHLLRSLLSAIQNLLLHSQITQLDPSIMNTHINDVKSFLRIYNAAHYRDFPKSGCCSVDLSQFKGSVTCCCNDVMNAVRSAFSMSLLMEEVASEVKSIQELLTAITTRLNLPQTIIRAAVQATAGSITREMIKTDPLAKLIGFWVGLRYR